MPIIRRLLGEDCILGLLSAHISLPGSDMQPVRITKKRRTKHLLVFLVFCFSFWLYCFSYSDIDYEPLFDMYQPVPPYCVYVHIPLVDLTEENGPTEFWRGATHLSIHNAINDLREFEKLPIMMLPSERVTIAAGGVVLKDMRCFHRGTPNNSKQARPILSLVYCRKWYRIPYGKIDKEAEAEAGNEEKEDHVDFFLLLSLVVESLYKQHGYPPLQICSENLEVLSDSSRKLLRLWAVKHNTHSRHEKTINSIL
jgi:hypothetical protein